MAKNRIVATPAVHDLAKLGGNKTFWKQVLPQSSINYTTGSGKRSSITFDEKYLSTLVKAFNEKALDQVPFLLADADNRHTMDPERFRGKVSEMRLAEPNEKPGLYAKIEFSSKEAARAVLDNPDLGVSCRIREGLNTSDGRQYGAGVIHVLGTMDPQVVGMDSWKPIELSQRLGAKMLDLSNSEYTEEISLAKKGWQEKLLAADTEEEIDAIMADVSEEEIGAFLAEFAPEYLGDLDEEDEEAEEADDEDEDEDDDESAEDGSDVDAEVDDKELEPALSAQAKKDIQLATARAEAAEIRLAKIEQKAADAEWETFKSAMLDAGAPPVVLNLAEPVLHRATDMVLDLANSDEDINLSEIVRALVEHTAGVLDLSEEQGHSGTAESDPDADLMNRWVSESPNLR